MTGDIYVYFLIIAFLILGLAVAMLMTHSDIDQLGKQVKALQAKLKPPASDDELDSDDLFGKE